MRCAAIDVGTNTVRLLVADVDAAGLDRVDAALEVTRLGQGVDAARRLDPDAVARTVAVVVDFARRARDAGAERIRVAGTSALRDAADAAGFAERVRSSAGVTLEVISGEQEGRLAFQGATYGLREAPSIVCDIGGGSTEFVRGTSGAEGVWSAEVGSVRVRERYLRSDPPTRGEIAGARSVVAAELVRVERAVGLVGDERLIGVGGTVTALAALVLGLERYDRAAVHDSRLTAADVEAWTDRLCAMPVAEVRALPSMHPGRADVICAGALILSEVLRRWGSAEVLVRESDILDGLILDTAGPPGAGEPAAGRIG